MPDSIVTTKARVKVKGSGNVFFDISNADFEIFPEPLSVNKTVLEHGLSIYPNPASTTVYIANKNTHTLQVTLYSAVGQKVWSGAMTKDLAIPVGHLSKGMYYLQVMDTNNGAIVAKPVTVQ